MMRGSIFGGALLAGGGVSGGGVPTFTDGAAMDAQAVVGREYHLIGSTTRAIIARLVCATVGPVTYEILGPINWFQATGTEFTGVLKPAALGPATFSWGLTPGSQASAGLILTGDGSVEIQGLAPLSYLDNVVRAWFRAGTIPLVAGNAVWCGVTRAADKSTMAFGGAGVNATPQWRGATGVGQSVTAPGLTVGANDFGVPSAVRNLRLLFSAEAALASNLTTIAYGSTKDPSGASSTVGGDYAVWGAAASDRIPVLGARGGPVRILTTEIVRGNEI